MPELDDNTLVYGTVGQMKTHFYDPVRTDQKYKGKIFTPSELEEAILEIVGRAIGNSTAIIRTAAEDIPYNYFVCEKNELSIKTNKATQIGDEVRQYKRIAKLSETKIMIGWLIDERVYLRIYTQNQDTYTWSPSSLTYQVHGRSNLRIRHFDLIGMSPNVAVLGMLPTGDDSTQHLLRISILGDSIYEQGETTTISDQFGTYIALCRLTNTKFMCAIWGYDFFENNSANPYKGTTFVHEFEMYPFITGGSAKQVFVQNKLAYYAGLGHLTATKKLPGALTMMALDENSVVLARLANYDNYVITEIIRPHATAPQVLVTVEALVHQDSIQGATKICSTLLPPSFIVSCVVAQNRVFCIVDKLNANTRVLKTSILDGTPDEIAVKSIGRNAFVFLATWTDANSKNSQMIKFRYNEANNSIVELGKAENLQLGDASLEVLNYTHAVLCGNRYTDPDVLKLTLQPVLISSGVAIAHQNDEIIGVSDVDAKAGDNVVISCLAERYPGND